MRKTIRLSILAILLCAPLFAEESPIHHVLTKGKAIVSIEGVDAAIYQDKPQGIFDPSTGQVLVIQRMRRVAAVEAGGGFILSSDGVIAAAAHTLSGKNNIMVTLHDGTRLPAKILKMIPERDIALIGITPPAPLETISFADSDRAQAGMPVYAMGRAQFLQGTMTGGEITAFGFETVSGHTTIGTQRMVSLQINFKAYKGDSGSPVLNSRGELIGMISAGRTAGSETFAVPSNRILEAYREFIGQ